MKFTQRCVIENTIAKATCCCHTISILSSPLIITPTSIHFSLFFLKTDCNLILIFFKNIRSLYGLHHSHTYNRYLMSSVLHCFPLWVKSVITPRTSVFGTPRSIPMQLSPRMSLSYQQHLRFYVHFNLLISRAGFPIHITHPIPPGHWATCHNRAVVWLPHADKL